VIHIYDADFNFMLGLKWRVALYQSKALKQLNDGQYRVVRALYGLKSSGASWRAKFNNSIRDMGFEPTVADPDVYRRPFAKPDGFKYYEFIPVYVDDVLIISHAAGEHLKVIQATYELNPTSVGPPTRYLGADVEKVTRPGDPTGREN
jgi:hypothetical protein